MQTPKLFLARPTPLEGAASRYNCYTQSGRGMVTHE